VILLAYVSVVFVLFVVFIALMRISQWHGLESTYWFKVAAAVRLQPELDAHYRPVLSWAQSNRPSVITRIRGWRDPEYRMMGAGIKIEASE
jgi:hypothetical protein